MNTDKIKMDSVYTNEDGDEITTPLIKKHMIDWHSIDALKKTSLLEAVTIAAKLLIEETWK